MSTAQLLLILEVLDHLALIVEMAPAVRERWVEYSDKIQEMVKANRDPSSEEWAELEQRLNDSSARLLAAAANLEVR
jgi:hypothetical protein